MGDGVSLPIPPQFGCDECILTHITLYLNQKGGKSRAKLVGSSWYLTPLLWDTPIYPGVLFVPPVRFCVTAGVSGNKLVFPSVVPHDADFWFPRIPRVLPLFFSFCRHPSEPLFVPYCGMQRSRAWCGTPS